MDVTSQIIDVYAREGMECVAESHLGIRENTSIGAVPEERVAEMLRDVAVPQADVLAVVCTNFWGGRIAPQIEAHLRVPVLDSVTITLWHALQLAGAATEDLVGWGRIFESTIADAGVRAP
jgi:maleate isomerase